VAVIPESPFAEPEPSRKQIWRYWRSRTLPRHIQTMSFEGEPAPALFQPLITDFSRMTIPLVAMWCGFGWGGMRLTGKALALGTCHESHVSQIFRSSALIHVSYRAGYRGGEHRWLCHSGERRVALEGVADQAGARRELRAGGGCRDGGVPPSTVRAPPEASPDDGADGVCFPLRRVGRL
jgi:hypothetical protein